MNTPWHASLKAINFVFLAALLGFLFSPIEANAKDDVRFSSREHEQAVALMEEDPDRSEKVLEKASTATEWMDYALFLHAFRSHTERTIWIIRNITDKINAAALDRLRLADKKFERATEGKELSYRFLYGMEGPWRLEPAMGTFGPPTPYDGSDKSLITTLRYGSAAGVIQTGFPSYDIPCGVLSRRPVLIEAIAGALYGGNRDNGLPGSGCRSGRGRIIGFPDTLTERYIKMAAGLDGHFLENYTGSFRFTHARVQAAALEELRLNPAVGSIRKPGVPYETWSYLSLSNRRTFLAFKPVYQELLATVAVYYRQRKGLTEPESIKSARVRLAMVVFGADCGKELPRPSLRKLIIDRAPLARIQSFIHSSQFRNSASLEPFRECARHAGIDPLIHIAVNDVEVLRYLRRFTEAMPLTADEERKMDFQMGINAGNAFHKTPLMTAAQHDLIASARFLIRHRASINSVTDSSEIYSQLEHDHRTALMYAAASGSLAMIRLLLDSGADPELKDSRGLKAIDYLTGKGSLEPNTRFNAGELSRATKLLLAVQDDTGRALHGTGNHQGVGKRRVDLVAQCRKLYSSEQYRQAFTFCLKASEQGSAKAQIPLGLMFYQGKGVDQNYTEAAKWLRKAAVQGDALMQFILAFMYDRGQGVKLDRVEAAKWFRKAADQSVPEAQNSMGSMYYKGEGVKQDYKVAVKWYRKAAEQGNSEAQFNLGMMYARGLGISEDSVEAVKWLRRAAAQGHTGANKILPLYTNKIDKHPLSESEQGDQSGQSTTPQIQVEKQGYAKLVKALRRQADVGDVSSQYNMGVMYSRGLGVEKSDVEAVKWWRKAAEQGHRMGQNNLGAMYYLGRGVKQDYVEAVRWYLLAAEQGSASAQGNMGILYRDGLGVKQDYAEAIKWFRKAAEGGDSGAQNNLGVMYNDGVGVKQDRLEAEKWWRKAAEQGNESARSNLHQVVSQ